MQNEYHHEANICTHVFDGAFPDVVEIENKHLMAVLCYACADAAQTVESPEQLLTLMLPMCRCQLPTHVRDIQNQFPESGLYLLQENGTYEKQPVMCKKGNA